MRIALDLQSRQTLDSRDRGIGRYSLALAKAMLKSQRGHDFSLLLNGAFDRSIESVKADFEVEADDPRIEVYQTLPNSTEWKPEDGWRYRASRYLRQSYIASRRFDFVHCTSLFENPADSASTAWGDVPDDALQGVTLYDLIPYAFPDIYLQDALMRASYFRKIQLLRKADLLLAISAFSRSEAITRLGLDPSRVVDIAGAADERFRQVAVEPEVEQSLRARFGLGKFIMYTGGIDHRKNIERLIQAYATLPAALVADYQLVVVCGVQPAQREVLLRLAASHGVPESRVIMTGYVKDDDLVALYNLCELFVFPSWCEGFGLPVLEAMQCGAPVIAARTSSLPEVVGCADALFDPYSVDDMRRVMARALEDAQFRARLVEHGAVHSRKFTWEGSAAKALDAIEEAHRRRIPAKARVVAPRIRPRLAFVSPLPPSRSGIAGYSAQLLPYLEPHYEITLICGSGEVSDDYLSANFSVRTPDWLRKNAERFDRVIYQFGNSDHHAYMFRLLEEVPGTVVLHDFWLSHVLEYLQLHHPEPYLWDEHLHYSHGWPALARRKGRGHDLAIIDAYPGNRRILDMAEGVIVHSEASAKLAAQWYGEAVGSAVRVVNSQKALATDVDKKAAKAQLGGSGEQVLICSFGFIDATKHSLRLARSFAASSAYRQGTARLVFVGQNAGGEYGQQIADVVANSKGRISFTGFVSDTDYDLYLRAADLAVQLRGRSRGETSAAALDCLAYDVALIVNENLAFSQIPDEAAIRLPQDFDDTALAATLDEALYNDDMLNRLRKAGRKYLREKCHPAIVAAQYRDAIEHFNEHGPVAWRARTIDRLGAIAISAPSTANDMHSAASAVRANFPLPGARPRVFLDENLLSRLDEVDATILRGALVDPEQDELVDLLRIEQSSYVNPVGATAAFLGQDAISLPVTAVDLHAGDVCVLVGTTLLDCYQSSEGLLAFLRDARMARARVICFWPGLKDDVAQRGAAAVAAVIGIVAPYLESVAVENEKSARLIGDYLKLANDPRAAAVPTYFPGEGRRAGIDELRLLAAPGAGDIWQLAKGPPSNTLAWSAAHQSLRTQSGELRDGAFHATGREGFIVHGPYASVPAGRYALRIIGSLNADQAATQPRYEVTIDGGDTILSVGELSGVNGRLGVAEFTLEAPVHGLEIRIWADGATRMSVCGYYLQIDESI